MHVFKCKYKKPNPIEFCMTEKDIREAIQDLEHLIECAKKGNINWPNVGICGNWNTPRSYDLVAMYATSWDKTAHPEEHSEYPIPRDYYKRELWQGEQRDLRINLMEHILSNLNKVLEDM